MSQSEAIQNIINTGKEMVGYDCDEIHFRYVPMYSAPATDIFLGANYTWTTKTFYRIRLLSKWKIEQVGFPSMVFYGNVETDDRLKVCNLLVNRVVTEVLFDIETFELSIKFDNDLSLTIYNDEDKENYELRTDFAGHGEFYVGVGKKLDWGIWDS